MDAPINDDCANNSEQTTILSRPIANVDVPVTDPHGPAPSTPPHTPSPPYEPGLDGMERSTPSRAPTQQSVLVRMRLHWRVNMSMKVVDIMLKSRTGIVEFLDDEKLKLFRKTVRHIIHRNLHEIVESLPKYAREINHDFYARKAILEAVHVRWNLFLVSKDDSGEPQTIDECVPSELISAAFYED